MKTVKAYQNKNGDLFNNREDYVASEIAGIVAVGTDIPTEKIVDAILQHRELVCELLHARKERGPNKPKAVA